MPNTNFRELDFIEESMPAKNVVQKNYLSIHESKLSAIPENFSQSVADLTERPGVMYEQGAYERADWQERSWGLMFEFETEARAKQEERRQLKCRS